MVAFGVSDRRIEAAISMPGFGLADSDTERRLSIM
jgi:hypothetical protein